jgi:hypothetical protein
MDLEYWFAKDGGTAGKKEPEGAAFILESGTYVLTVKGLLKEGGSLVAQGEASFTIIAGQDAGTVNVILRPVVTGEGTGSLEFGLVYPAGVTVESLTLAPIPDGSTNIDLLESADTSGTDPVTLSGTKSGIPVGYYLLRVILSNGDGDVAGKREVVHIYQNLTARTELAGYTFKAEDFNESSGQPVNTGVSVWINEDDGAILASNDNITLFRDSSDSFTAAVNGGYSDIQWYVSGTPVTGTSGTSITINAADYPRGRYILGVTVTKDGIPYSTDIRFTVDISRPPEPPVSANPHERLGVYVYDRNPSGVEFFSDWVGLDVKYAEDFLGYDYWQSYTGEWPQHYNPIFWSAWKAANPDKKLILAVSPFPKDGLTGGSDYDKASSAKARQNYQDAAAGAFNNYYRQLGEKLKELGLGDTIIRFGHEMSGNWYVYSICAGGDSEAVRQEKQINYGKAFNEFAKTLLAIEGTNFKFCWNPATDAEPDYLTRCYPGDQYVDYIAFDQYDYWMNAYDNDTYHNSTDPAVRLTYQQTAWNQMMNRRGNPNWFANFAQAHNKPLAIAEWGLWRDNRNSGYDNPYFIQQMYNWINSHDIAWHTYFMFGDVSHSLYDTVTYPLASQKFQELWNPAQSPQVTPAIAPSDVSGYNAATVKKGRDAVMGDSVALVSDPWAWSGGILAGMWTQNNSYNANNMAITFENCPASSGFALVYQLWHSNLSNSESDNNQRVSLYVNGTLVKSGITLTHGGRGWGDSYKIMYFDDVTVPAGASVKFSADQYNWAWTRLNFDYIVFK